MRQATGWLLMLGGLWGSGLALAQDPLDNPGAPDLLRAAAAQLEAGDQDAARATLVALGLPMDGGARPAKTASPEAIMQRVSEGEAALKAGDVAAARAKWVEARGMTDDPRALDYLDRMLATVASVGDPAGALEVEQVIQGDLPSWGEGATLVFFFESWCPHCRREMPEMQQRLATLQARGIHLLALTRLSRDTPIKEVRQLLKSSGARFPVAVETGEIAARFGVEGIPAAAVVQDGVIVWRGHPQQLGDEALDRFSTE